MKTAIEHYEAALKEAFPKGATGDVFHHWNEARKALEQPAQEEPVGQMQEEVYGRGQVMWFKKPADKTMLYTRPQAREPLTDEEIKELYGDDDNFRMTKKYVVAFARAIEANLREKNT